MFAADRWARAFVAVLPAGAEAEEGLALLQALAGPLAGIRGLFSGVSAASRLERTLRAALAEAPEASPVTEKAFRFVVLLVRRGRYRYIHEVIGAIGKLLDERKGIVPVSVESAFPLEGSYEEKLIGLLKEQTGAREIRLETRVNPELLGGCRLRIGSESLDATLRAQLQRMTEDLAVPLEAISSRGMAAIGGL